MDLEKLYCGFNNNDLYLKACGHITASFCPSVKEMVHNFLSTQGPIKNVYVDLSECSYMDSTFMGLLIYFHKLIRDQAGSSLFILKPTVECVNLLKNLGILRLITISTEELPFPEHLEPIQKIVAPSAEFLLHAHQNLMELSEENRTKFMVVEKMLIEETKKNKS